MALPQIKITKERLLLHWRLFFEESERGSKRSGGEKNSGRMQTSAILQNPGDDKNHSISDLSSRIAPAP
jgi:hypothetical protein